MGIVRHSEQNKCTNITCQTNPVICFESSTLSVAFYSGKWYIQRKTKLMGFSSNM